jgi:hypothetical protein
MSGDAEELGRRVRESLQMMRIEKERLLREEGPDRNINPRLAVWRADNLVALVMMSPQEVNGDSLRTLAGVVIRGLRADVVTITYEGWGLPTVTGPDGKPTMNNINPDTGREWAREEMSEYVRKHGRDGVVIDQIVVQAVSLLADVHATQGSVPRNGAFGWTLDWQEPMFSDEQGVQVGGAMIETFRTAISDVPTLQAELAALSQQYGAGAEEAEALADAAVVRELAQQGLSAEMVLTCAPEQVIRQAVITRVMKAKPPEDLDAAVSWTGWN